MVAPWEAAMARDMADMMRLAAALDQAALEVPALTRGVARQIGENTVKWAKEIVPVRTHDLQKSIDVEFDVNGWWFEAGPTMEYGGYVEYGTTKMAPQPYMGPAFERAVYEGLGELEAVLGRIL